MDRLKLMRSVRCNMSCLAFVGAVASSGCAADEVSGAGLGASVAIARFDRLTLADERCTLLIKAALRMPSEDVRSTPMNDVIAPSTNCAAPADPSNPELPDVPPETHGNDPTPPGWPGK